MPSTAAETASRAKFWHQSGVETILSCPRRFLLETILQVPQDEKLSTVAGTSHHSGVEAHERARMAGNADGITEAEQLAVALAELDRLLAGVSAELLADYALKQATPAVRRKLEAAAAAEQATAGRQQLVGEVEASVANWWHAPVREDGATTRDVLLAMTPLRIEHYLRVPVIAGAADLAGTMDGLYRDADGRIVLVDQKTSGKMAGWGDGDDEHRDQATFYSLLTLLDPELAALDGVTDGLPPMLFCVVRRAVAKRKSDKWVGATLQWVRPDNLDVADLGARVRKAETIKAAGDFPADPTSRWCKWCPFYERCAPGDGSLAGPPAGVIAGMSAQRTVPDRKPPAAVAAGSTYDADNPWEM